MPESSSQNVVHGAVHGLGVIALAVTSLILVKRVEKCAPGETDQDKMQRQTIMVTSGILIALVIIKAITSSFPRLNRYHMYAEGICYLAALILSIVNIVYISNAGIDNCSAQPSGADIVATKNLAVFVLIISVIILLYLVKKAIMYVGGYKKSSPKNQ